MRKTTTLIVLFLFIALYCTVLTASDAATQTGEDVSGIPKQKALKAGERMYRDGILPSGKPMEAVVQGDILIEGTMFACTSCHMRSGIGSVEGGVFTPPVTGGKLYQPFQLFYKGRQQKYYPIPPLRPAYTDSSLAEVIRYGFDPTGRMLNEVMPRYILSNADMEILIDYLRSLSSQFSPGVSETNIHFATIITEDAAPELRDTMLVALENYVRSKNNMAAYYQSPAGLRARVMAESMLGSKEMALRTLSLSRWVLKGKPETWKGQLQEYLRKDPVFALLGGITGGEWTPIHEFCEENRLPCIFPNTDFPVISENDWYTQYLSKGYYQEGETAALYLNSIAETLKDRPVVQIVRGSRRGKTLAAGFQNTWMKLGHPAAVTLTVKTGTAMNKEYLQKLLAKDRPAAILLWDGPDSVSALKILSAMKNKPDMVFISSGYFGKDLWTLPEKIRDLIYITYPFRLPQNELKYKNIIDQTMKNIPARSEAQQKVLKQTYALIQILTEALMDMRGSYYRDSFFDVIGMMMDQDLPLYERLSFGPGQRYASKGCYIVQLSKSAKPELVRKSDWVIH